MPLIISPEAEILKLFLKETFICFRVEFVLVCCFTVDFMLLVISRALGKVLVEMK